MAKIGLIFPYQDIMDIAQRILPDTDLDVAYQKVVETTEAVEAARDAVEAGADIIVARGYQAMLIMQYTNVPVVALRLHAQEIGMLLKKSREIVKKDRPRIGLVVFKNMLCDMSRMEELFSVELKIAQVNRTEEIMDSVHDILDQGVDLFIGGATVCDEANNLGYPALLYQSSDESVREALREADRMSYAMESEKRNEAQFETILDTTFNGIIKINADGCITVINKQVENLIGKNVEDVVGLPVGEVFPEFEEKMIRDILDGKSDSYTVSVNLRKQAWILLMAPIEYEGAITGAILSLQKLSEGIKRQTLTQRDMYLNGYTARHEFRDFHVENERMAQQLELAKKYALSDSPVLIYGETGTESMAVAESIHNNSSRKNGPFISVNLGAVSPENQVRVLFGERRDMQSEREKSADLDEENGSGEERMKAAAVRANHGTLFLQGIELLNTQAQDRLLQLLHGEVSPKIISTPVEALVVRVIVSTDISLRHLVDQGEYSRELFYLLQSLVVELPPLRERKEDLAFYSQQYFAEFSQKYNKYLVLTNGARNQILSQRWEGNLLQLKGFCERLVLTADKRSIDEVAVQKLYESLYPETRQIEGQEKTVVYQSREAEELNRLLERYHGNRQAVAKELGISTTTLWRRMKKYGVEAKFN